MTTVEFQSKPIRDCVAVVLSWNPQRDSDSDEIVYIDLSSVSQATKTVETHSRILAKEAPSRARQLVRAGDILVSTVRPNLNGVARVPDSLDGATASTGFCVLRPDEKKVSGEYLLHWVKTPMFISDMTKRATGASYPAVSDRIILDSLLPLPPLPEQQRIAAILDQAETLRVKRRHTHKQIDLLARSVFLDFFGDPVSNSKGLPTLPLGEIARFVGGGTPSRAVDAYYDGAICWATSKDMKGELLRDTQEHITERAIEESATNLVHPGTILVVVKSKILMHHLPVLIATVPTCFGQDLKGIILKQPWSSRYIARHLRLGKKWLLDRARGVNTEGLTLDHLREYPVLVPPPALVERYDQIEQTIELQRERMNKSLTKLEALFASLQHRAFRGEL